MRRDERTARAGAAFTLVELVAVLVLLALLSTAGVVSLKSALQDAAAADAAGGLRRQDRLLREHAVRTGRPVVLRFDSANRRLDCVDARTGGALGAGWDLPPGADVRRVIASTGRPGGAGDVGRIECSPRGQTPSYVVLLEGRDRKRQWWFVAGLTGQFTLLRDEAETLQLLDPSRGAAAAGNDAD